MNPEFRRNTWLELSPLRVWAVPLVVLALAFVVNALGKAPATSVLNWDAFRTLGLTIFALFAIWGGHKVGQSVTNEVLGGTWDMQRLAEHRPWELLVGKLFGSAVFDWYGAAFGLILFALGSAAIADAGAVVRDVFSLMLAMLWLHGLALFASLAAAIGLRATRRPTANRARPAGAIIAIILVSTWIGPGLVQTLSGGETSKNLVHWWWTMPVSTFVPLSLAMFIFWTLLGAHRLLRAELQEPVSPTPWIGFLLFLTAYNYPFVPGEVTTKLGNPLVVFFCVFALVCGLLFYPGLLGERKDTVRLRSLAAAWSRGDGRGVWTRLPLWTFTFVGYALSVLGLAVCGPFWQTPEVWIMVGVTTSFGLFMLRDIGWILGVHLAPNPGRRPDLVVLFFLAVLYGLIPMVITALGEGAFRTLYLFLPGLPVVQAAKEAAVSIFFPALWALPGCAIAWVFAWPRLQGALRRG